MSLVDFAFAARGASSSSRTRSIPGHWLFRQFKTGSGSTPSAAATASSFRNATSTTTATAATPPPSRRRGASGVPRLAGQILPLGSGFRYIFDPLSFATDVLGWQPDEKQCEALNARSARTALNWARQCGKSTVAAVRAIHIAATRPGSLTVVIGGVGDHINAFFDRLDAFLEADNSQPGGHYLLDNEDGETWSGSAHGWLGGPVTKSAGNRVIRRFPNRSRIVGLTTSKAVRSHTARCIILDEAGYIDDRVWEGVLPTLATTNGDIWVVGTPKGAKGWYYDLWKSSGSGRRSWFKSQYAAVDNARISPEYLEEMRQTRGDSWMRQEFGCEFLHDGQTLLHPDDVDALFDDRPVRRQECPTSPSQ